jgi:hypothetical protein
LLGRSWERLDQMKNFCAASAQLATFLLGGFVLRDERWLKELRIKYDEQRRGSCDAACSVPRSARKRLLGRSWERLDQMRKTSAQHLRSLRLLGTLALLGEKASAQLATFRSLRLSCSVGWYSETNVGSRSYEPNTMRSVGAVATPLARYPRSAGGKVGAASAQRAT